MLTRERPRRPRRIRRSPQARSSLTTDEGAARLAPGSPARAGRLARARSSIVDAAAIVRAARARPPADPLRGRPARARRRSSRPGSSTSSSSRSRRSSPAGSAATRGSSLVEGADLLPGGPPRGGLLGVRRDGDHLFLRYELDVTVASRRRRIRAGRPQGTPRAMSPTSLRSSQALTNAALAGSLAACIVWFGPPGTDFAAHVFQLARLPPPRLRALDELLVRGPLHVRRLQPPLLPARRARRDPAARRAQRAASTAAFTLVIRQAVGRVDRLGDPVLRGRRGGVGASPRPSRTASGSRSR